jgi:hypothetical protein
MAEETPGNGDGRSLLAVILVPPSVEPAGEHDLANGLVCILA